MNTMNDTARKEHSIETAGGRTEMIHKKDIERIAGNYEKLLYKERKGLEGKRIVKKKDKLKDSMYQIWDRYKCHDEEFRDGTWRKSLEEEINYLSNETYNMIAIQILRLEGKYIPEKFREDMNMLLILVMDYAERTPKNEKVGNYKLRQKIHEFRIWMVNVRLRGTLSKFRKVYPKNGREEM